jgi:hypothetical protein
LLGESFYLPRGGIKPKPEMAMTITQESIEKKADIWSIRCPSCYSGSPSIIFSLVFFQLYGLQPVLT